jgi:hypothetical protein
MDFWDAIDGTTRHTGVRTRELVVNTGTIRPRFARNAVRHQASDSR